MSWYSLAAHTRQLLFQNVLILGSTLNCIPAYHVYIDTGHKGDGDPKELVQASIEVKRLQVTKHPSKVLVALDQ